MRYNLILKQITLLRFLIVNILIQMWIKIVAIVDKVCKKSNKSLSLFVE